MNIIFHDDKIDQNEASSKEGYWTYGKCFKTISHNFVPCITKASEMLFEDGLKLFKKKSKDGIQVDQCLMGTSYVLDIVQNSEKNTRENIPQTTGEMD